MNPERQRIAIAEACGWKRDRPNIIRSPSNVFRRDGRSIHKNQLPDYPNDLDAMHEAEERIAPHWDTYFGQLIQVRWRDAQPERHPRDLSPASATATQRAEAFLKTIGKWENEL